MSADIAIITVQYSQRRPDGKCIAFSKCYIFRLFYVDADRFFRIDAERNKMKHTAKIGINLNNIP